MNLEQLHNLYLTLRKELFGQTSKVPYMIWERYWYEWCKAGFDDKDLNLVMRWVAWSNKTKDFKYNVTIQAIMDLEKFSAWLELATGWHELKQKPKVDPNKVEVLRQTFRPPPEQPTRPISDVIKAMKEAAN